MADKKPRTTKGAKAKTTTKSPKKPTSKPASSVKSKKRRQLKAVLVVSVRDKATTAAQKTSKPRKLHKARSAAWKPFKAVFAFLGRVLRPFRFLLAPFRTRPARAMGRFLASVLLLRYFRESWKELRQVEWPNARTTAKLTLAVFLFAIVFGLFVSLVDYIIGLGVEKLIIK